MKKIIIVPTSHISADSIRRIKEVLKKEEPDCVAVELDQVRFKALKENKSGSAIEMLKNMGVPTFLIFYLLKYLQQKLGGKVGIMPGADMLTAVNAAAQNKIKVAFIDMDIRMTAYKFKTQIPIREKLSMIYYIIQAGIFMTFGKLFFWMKKDKTIDLSKVPESDFIKEAMKVFEDKFPNLYKILLTDRNNFMVKNIISLLGLHDKIVVVMGAGHEEGIRELLEKNLKRVKEEND